LMPDPDVHEGLVSGRSAGTHSMAQRSIALSMGPAPSLGNNELRPSVVVVGTGCEHVVSPREPVAVCDVAEAPFRGC
jgi:hypothetical protein